MAEAIPTTQTQPDVNAQIAALTGVVTKLAEGQQALIQTLAARPAAAAPAPEPAPAKKADDAAAKPVTAADVQRMVTEALTTAQQSQALTAQRQQYAGDKLKDLPEVYRNQLGTDPTKWAAEEQAIRQRYQADFKAAGGKVADVGGGTAAGEGGAKPGNAVDYSKLTPGQLIELGVKGSKPGEPTTTPAAAVTTVAAGGTA